MDEDNEDNKEIIKELEEIIRLLVLAMLEDIGKTIPDDRSSVRD